MWNLSANKPKKPRRSIETHLEKGELQKLKILAAELRTSTVNLTTQIIRAAVLIPENREYVEQLIRQPLARE